MSKIELEFIEQLSEVETSLRLILYHIKSKIDITEEDWDVLKYYHRIYWSGEMPFFKSKPNMTNEMSYQQGLFSDSMSATQKGTKVDYKMAD